MLYTHITEILFCNKKNWSMNPCYNMDGPWKHVMGKEPIRKPHIVWFHLSEIPRTDKAVETEGRLAVDRGWREGGMKVTASRYRFYIYIYIWTFYCHHCSQESMWVWYHFTITRVIEGQNNLNIYSDKFKIYIFSYKSAFNTFSYQSWWLIVNGTDF